MFYVKDRLGSVRTVVDGSGTVVEWKDYYPYGLQMADRSRHHGRDFAGSPTGPGSYAFGVPYQSHSDNDKGDGRQASGNEVDPTTLRQNAFGTNWIGGDNPQTVNGEPAYGVPPVNLAGIPALKHDKTGSRS